MNVIIRVICIKYLLHPSYSSLLGSAKVTPTPELMEELKDKKERVKKRLVESESEKEESIQHKEKRKVIKGHMQKRVVGQFSGSEAGICVRYVSRFF